MADTVTVKYLIEEMVGTRWHPDSIGGHALGALLVAAAAMKTTKTRVVMGQVVRNGRLYTIHYNWLGWFAVDGKTPVLARTSYTDLIADLHTVSKEDT